MRIQKKLKGQMISGTAAMRGMLASAKRLPNWKVIRERQHMAQQLGKPDILIPKDDGYRLFEPGTFEETSAIVQSALDIVAEARPEEHITKKRYLITGLLDQDTFNLDSPVMRFALRPDILSTVTNYLGVVPILSHVDVWYSRMEVGADDEGSQLYHLDWADQSQVKIFIYSTDVTKESGPLTIVSAKDSARVQESLHYRFKNRVSDEQMFQVIDKAQEIPIMGPTGTTAFVDTSRCFHYGSRVTSSAESRILTLIQFLTPTAFALPVDFSEAASYKHLATAEMSPLQRAVLGADN